MSDEHTPASRAPSSPQQYPDRVYRSGGALAGGVMLLALAAWLGADGVLAGSGTTRWTVLAVLLLAVPLVVAFTLRPAVYAGEQRMRVRNPFRTITVPWTSVEGLQAGYSCEVIADGRKYVLWSVPVSIRARRSANRYNARLARGDKRLTGDPRRATSDQIVDELRELVDKHGQSEPVEQVRVSWSWEILAPAAAGAVALAAVLVV